VIAFQCLLGSLLLMGARIVDLPDRDLLRVFLGALVWGVGLGGGGFAVSAAFPPAGRAGPDAPLPFPPSAFGWCGIALMLGGLGAAPAISWWSLDAYLAGVILVVLYATPPIALKRLLVPDLLVQALGGGLTLYAGIAVLIQRGHALPDRRLLLCMAGAAFLLFAARALLAERFDGLLTVLFMLCVANGFACLVLGLDGLGRPTRALWAAGAAWGGAGLLRPALRQSDAARHRLAAGAVGGTQVILAGILLQDIL
jgi:hypothetical protein